MSTGGRWYVRGLLSMLTLALGAPLCGAVTFTVTNTNPSGGGSLAEAITSANTASDLDTVEFAIPGGGVPIIVASLPAITQPVVIDGTSQTAGFVEVRNGGGTALSITGSGSTVQGMVLNSSSTGIALGAAAGGNTITGCRIGTDATGTMALANQTGVFIQGPSGGGNTITGNLISGNTPNGVSILGANNVVVGNVIGLNVSQTQAIGGGTGVLINNASGNRVGGTQPGEGNVIAGLAGNGISVTNVSAQGTLIQGNRIGTNAANAAGLGVAVGVSFASTAGAGNVLGGTDAGAGNLIVGATSNGVSMLNSSNVTIQGNTIGTAALPNAGHGFDLAGADGNLFEGNVVSSNGQAGFNVRSGADDNTFRDNEIVDNGSAGIAVSGGQRDRFTENAINGNGGLGIDLGPTGVSVNDALDADVAPGHNDAQNYPVLSTPSAMEVTGTIHSTPSTAFTIELFASVSCDASGNGEGQTFLGALQAMTDAAGNTATFMLSLPPTAAGQVITSTATAPNGNTSEFSACTSPVPGGTTSTQPSSSTSTSSTSTTSTSTTTTSATATTSTTSSTTSSSSTSSSTSSSSTSTTTSSSVTTSSAPPTTTTSSSTTSTTLGGTCATEPVAPTFRSLNCRLAALIARTRIVVAPGPLQARLLRLLEMTRERKESGEATCRESDSRRTKQRLKRAIRSMINFGRTLGLRRTRKALETTLREELREAGEGLRVDLRTLKRSVRCPDDAP